VKNGDRGKKRVGVGKDVNPHFFSSSPFSQEKGDSVNYLFKKETDGSREFI
jgi:hypothetical protein